MLYMIPQSVRTCRIPVLCLMWTAGKLYPGHSSLLGNAVVRYIYILKQEEVKYAKKLKELMLMKSEEKSAVGCTA